MSSSGPDMDLDSAWLCSVQVSSDQDGQLVSLSFPMFISTLMHGNIDAVVAFIHIHETFMQTFLHWYKKCQEKLSKISNVHS